jgi:hypothetical protein
MPNLGALCSLLFCSALQSKRFHRHRSTRKAKKTYKTDNLTRSRRAGDLLKALALRTLLRVCPAFTGDAEEAQRFWLHNPDARGAAHVSLHSPQSQNHLRIPQQPARCGRALLATFHGLEMNASRFEYALPEGYRSTERGSGRRAEC